MKLEEAVKIMWEKAKAINFGGEKDWSSDIFTKEWFKNKGIGRKNRKPGLYWFISNDLSINKLKNLKPSYASPATVINFSERSADVIKIIGEEDYPDMTNKKFVFYNGESDDVFTRIRQHFDTNERTGGLGLKYYNISQNKFTVKIFYLDMIDELNVSDSDKKILKEYLKNDRVILDIYWREFYYWPILCEKHYFKF